MRHALTLACLIAAPAVAQNCDGWLQPIPSARANHAMVFDEARGVAVLFGGAQASAVGGTWEWNGQKWNQRFSDPAPSPRQGAGFVYDPDRQVCILFGGRDDSAAFLQDTWEWDGNTWTQVATTGPAPRFDFAMAYDRSRDTTVLFGGQRVSGSDNDTWEWNGTNWTQMATTGPSDRSGPQMVYDPSREKLVLHGGWTPGPSKETWEWDGASWSLITATGPGRYAHTLAYDEDLGSIVSYSGMDESYYRTAQTWQLSGSTWTLVHDGLGDAPEARLASAMVFDSVREELIVFGGDIGAGNGFFDDTWIFDDGQWSLVHTSPEPRTNGAMAFNPLLEEVMLFGGYSTSSPGNLGYNDLWSWNGSRWLQHEGNESNSPGPSQSAALAHDGSRLLLFDNDDEGPRTWAWDGAWSLVSEAGPDIGQFQMAYDPDRDRVVLFGGWPTAGETWEWNGTAWQQMATTGPSPRFGFEMAYDEANDQVLLYGGTVGSTRFAELWAWNGAAWNLIDEATAPGARVNATLSWDPDRQAMLLFGGSISGGGADELWMWNGQWTLLDAGNGPVARWLHSAAYDPTRRQLVVCLGDTTDTASDPALGDIWEYGDTFRIISQPRDQVPDSNDAVTLSFIADADYPLTFQWRKDGQPINDGGSVSGATTPTLRIDPFTSADEGQYDAVVTSNCTSTTSDIATLSVRCPADWNADAQVNTGDFLAYLNDYNLARTGQQPIYRDPDLAFPSGVLNTNDFVLYLAMYTSNCP